MKNINKLIKRDLSHIWHPCTQMKDHEKYPPIPIRSAKGSYLFTFDDKKIIDAISSWWCKSLGHSHPKIKKAVKKQLNLYEHIIPAGTTQKPLVELSEKLCSIVPQLNRVFYSDSGSSAIEISAKIAIQYHAQTGNPQRIFFVTLENGYHGETTLALSFGDCPLYSSHYSPILYKNIIKLSPLPYLEGKSSPLWNKIPEELWQKIESQLNENSAKIAGIIFEPILQGAGGILIYSKNLLERIADWAKKNNVLLIADEILTGFYRTGPVFASLHANIAPDIICLSKGLTAGWGAMSAILTTQKIYDAFYDDYPAGKAFLHSSTYAGNAISATAALSAMKIYEKEKIQQYVMENETELLNAIKYVAEKTNALTNLRSIGFVAAGDIVNPKTLTPYPRENRTGYKFYQTALKNGAFLRNLGDTVYFLPPLNTKIKTIRKLAKIAVKSLLEITKQPHII